MTLLGLPERSEREEELACDRLIAMIGGNDAVVKRSPPHKFLGTRGIPDRRYRLFGVAFDFEVKKGAGELSEFQILYLRAERECDNLAACGTVEDLLRCVEWIREAQRNERTYEELVALFGGVVETWVQKRDTERAGIRERKELRACTREQKAKEKAERAERRAQQRGSSA